MNPVPVAIFLSERHGPDPGGRAGLALALLLIALLLANQLRGPGSERRPPGPLPARRSRAARDGRHLFWAVALVLVVDLVIVVTERFVVLS